MAYIAALCFVCCVLVSVSLVPIIAVYLLRSRLLLLLYKSKLWLRRKRPGVTVASRKAFAEWAHLLDHNKSGESFPIVGYGSWRDSSSMPVESEPDPDCNQYSDSPGDFCCAP